MPTRAELLAQLRGAEPWEDSQVEVRVSDLGKLYARDIPEGVEVLPCSRVGESRTVPACEGTLIADAGGVLLAIDYMWRWKMWSAGVDPVGVVSQAAGVRWSS
jgi:hypothetical protein